MSSTCLFDFRTINFYQICRQHAKNYLLTESCHFRTVDTFDYTNCGTLPFAVNYHDSTQMADPRGFAKILETLTNK